MIKSSATNYQITARGSPAVIRTCLCALIIVVGLTLRKYGFAFGLPATIVKYGGSILWGAMVFFLAAIAWPCLSRGTPLFLRP
jgi:hypothetical protein